MILLVGGSWDGSWQRLKGAVLTLPKREMRGPVVGTDLTDMPQEGPTKESYLLETLNIPVNVMDHSFGSRIIYLYRHEDLTVPQMWVKILQFYAHMGGENHKQYGQVNYKAEFKNG